MRDLTGQKLGAYQLGGRLTSDAISAIYPSYQPNTRRAIGVKVFAEELAQKPGFVERFSQEMKRVAQLEHPHILPIYDLGVAGQNCFLVMQLPAGGTLESQSLSLDESLKVLEQIASALDFAHQQQIIHGSISPVSIFLEDGNSSLSDFGLVKILQDSGIQVFPSPYLAPEQWRGESLTPQTDVYMLGVLAFQLLTGKLPFEGNTNTLMRKHTQEEPPLANLVQPALSPAFNPLLSHALAKEPASRYATAGEFVEALKKASVEKPAPRSDVPDWLITPSEPADETSEWGDAGWGDTEFEDTFPTQQPDIYSTSSRFSSQDMSYYEWERQQQEIEAAQAKAAEPDIPLPDLPDLFEETPSAKPSTGGLAGDDYVPEWFMGVEELKDEDVPDFLKGASLDDSLLNPLGQQTPRPSTTPLPSPELEMPDFDDFMADLPEETPQIRKLDVQETGEEAVLLDDLLTADEETDQPAIRRLEPVESDESAVTLDDLFGVEEDKPVLDFRAEDDWLPADESLETAEEIDWLSEEAPSTTGNLSGELDSLFGLQTEPELPSMGEFTASDSVEEPALDLSKEIEFEAETDAEPDWLRGYDHEQEVATFQSEPDFPEIEQPAEPGEIPDWFGDIDFENVNIPDEPEIPLPTAYQPPAEETSDDFLDFDSLNVDDLFASVDTSLTSAQELSGLIEDEDFLSDFPSVPAEAEIEPASDLPFELPSDDEDIAPIQSEALPEWMKQAAASASAEQITLEIGGTEVRFDQIPDVALPDELRELREQMVAFLRKSNGAGETAKSGPLAGIEGALPPDNFLSTPGEITLGRTVRPTETQQQRVTSLKQVLQVVQEEMTARKAGVRYDLEKDEAPEPEIVKRPRRRLKSKRDRLVITLLLVLLVLAPFATDTLHLAADPPSELDENALPLAAAIDELGESRRLLPVLVAFEYGPAAAGELDPLANAVLRDILANGGRPVVVSTNPVGLLHAEQIFRDLSEDETLRTAIGRDLKSPDDYLILRLLPGGAAGVRQLSHNDTFATVMFAQDITGEETDLEIERVDEKSFAFLVVIGERTEDIRTWAEQTIEINLPRFALVTSAAEPMTRPYVSAGTYNGMVAGVGGTLMYDTSRNTGRKAPFETETSLPDPAISRWHSIATGILFAALVITGGAFINFVRALRRNRL